MFIGLCEDQSAAFKESRTQGTEHVSQVNGGFVFCCISLWKMYCESWAIWLVLVLVMRCLLVTSTSNQLFSLTFVLTQFFFLVFVFYSQYHFVCLSLSLRLSVSFSFFSLSVSLSSSSLIFIVCLSLFVSVSLSPLCHFFFCLPLSPFAYQYLSVCPSLSLSFFPLSFSLCFSLSQHIFLSAPFNSLLTGHANIS